MANAVRKEKEIEKSRRQRLCLWHKQTMASDVIKDTVCCRFSVSVYFLPSNNFVRFVDSPTAQVWEMARSSASLQSANYNSVCRNVYAHRDICHVIPLCMHSHFGLFWFLIRCWLESVVAWSRMWGILIKFLFYCTLTLSNASVFLLSLLFILAMM